MFPTGVELERGHHVMDWLRLMNLRREVTNS